MKLAIVGYLTIFLFWHFVAAYGLLVQYSTQTMAVFLWHQKGVRLCLACVSSKVARFSTYFVVQIVSVLTLWYKSLRDETGLAASTPWLKFGEIGVSVPTQNLYWGFSYPLILKIEGMKCNLRV